jgi:DNA-binding transcriptional regulator YdaS (Cro superfamily)
MMFNTVKLYNKDKEKAMVIERVIKHFGSKAKLARALGIQRSNITLWLSGAKNIPPKQAIEIEKITDGQFKAVDILGDADGDN